MEERSMAHCWVLRQQAPTRAHRFLRCWSSFAEGRWWDGGGFVVGGEVSLVPGAPPVAVTA